jgi:hypothetical protein
MTASGFGLLSGPSGASSARKSGVRVIADQQWTPELAEDVARAESVLFIDCSLDSAPGSVNLTPVQAGRRDQGINTHHQDAANCSPWDAIFTIPCPCMRNC